jgi:hypothetical protein
MIIHRAISEELVSKIDEMWGSYLVSFPPDAQRTKVEMIERLKPQIEKGFKREIFCGLGEDNKDLQTIGIYHVNQNFPFCYGEYIWTKNDLQNKSNGSKLHFACIDYLRESEIEHFVCEGHEDNPWHHKIGLGLIPVDYLQPAISDSQQDVNMTLLYDVNLGGKVLKSQDLLKIMDEIFIGIYDTKFNGTKYQRIMQDSINGREQLEIKL